MSEEVRRPAGVTAAAVVAMLGSLVAFLFAVVMLTTAITEPPGTQPAFRGPGIAMGAFVAVLAIIGLATGIGLLKLRAWARTAAVVFAGVLVFMGIFGVLLGLVMPPPGMPDLPAGAVRMIRVGTIVASAIQLLIGAWWLLLFNRASTSAAFAAASPDMDLGMPLSISLTAWASIVGGVLCLIPILARMPAVVLGVTLTGWGAGVFYAFFGALSIYIGRGLLDLSERARLLCIAWYVVTLAHTALVSYVPSLHAKTAAAQRAFMPQQAGAPLPDAAMTNLVVLCVAAIAALAIGYLHKHRALFRTTPEP